MNDLNKDCTHEGLDMILSLSHKLYEAQTSAFDAADSKAGSIVGYVAIAGSILGVSALGQAGASLPRALLILACVAFGAFAVAIIAAVAALWPRDTMGPPSALTAIRHWKVSGDFKTVASVVEGMDKAQKGMSSATKGKMWCLRAAFVLVVVGFVLLAAMTILRVVSPNLPIPPVK